MTNFALQILASAREQLLEEIIDRQSRVSEIDEFMAGRNVEVQEPAPEAKQAIVEQIAGAVAPVPSVEAEAITEAPVAQFAEQESDPHVDALIEQVAEQPASDEPPWQTPTPAAEAPASGRRTNDQIAAENGVTMEQVRAWKPKGRVSKADIEEFARSVRAGAAPQAPQAPGGPTTAPEPQQAAPAPVQEVAPQQAVESPAGSEYIQAPQQQPVEDPGFGAPLGAPVVEEPVVEWKAPF